MINKPEKLPIYPSTRLIGVELEIDPGNNGHGNTTLPSVRGWAEHDDGSIRDGVEFVLEPPLALPDALGPIAELCAKLIKVNVRRSGGLHVHVQVADYTHSDLLRLCKLYSHFQPVINKLVAPSRVNCRWCPPLPTPVTMEKLDALFRVHSPASSRREAKSSRTYSVCNCAMFRVSRPSERTVEFRQGSVSKKAHCVSGWATMLVALTDIGANSWGDQWLEQPATLETFKAMFKAQEERVDGKYLADWVQWRYDYLNQTPTEEDAKKLGQILTSPKGIYTISRELDTNLNYTKRLIDYAVENGIIATKRTCGGPATWVAGFEFIAEEDLAMLELKGEERDRLLMSLPTLPNETHERVEDEELCPA